MDREPRGDSPRNNPPRGLHDTEVRAAHLIVQPPQVSFHHRSEAGIDYHGGGSLIFAKFGQHFARKRDREPHLAGRLAHGFFVDGIRIRMKKADGNGVHACILNLAEHRPDFFLPKGSEHRAVVENALVDAEPQLTRYERLRFFRVNIIEHGAVLAPDLQNIFKARGGYQRGRSHGSFQERVGGNGGSMDHAIRGLMRDLG